jgi:hypothetical protein
MPAWLLAIRTTRRLEPLERRARAAYPAGDLHVWEGTHVEG